MESIYALDLCWESRTRREIEQRLELECQRSQNLSSPFDLDDFNWRPIYQKRKQQIETMITSNVQSTVAFSWQIRDSMLDARSAALGHGATDRLNFYDHAMEDQVREKKMLLIGCGTGGLLSMMALHHGASSIACYETSAMGYEVSNSVLEQSKSLKSSAITLSMDPVILGSSDYSIIVVDLGSHRLTSLTLSALGKALEHVDSSVLVIPSHVTLKTQILSLDPKLCDQPGHDVRLAEALKDLRSHAAPEMIDLSCLLLNGSGIAMSEPQQLKDLSICEAARSISTTDLIEVPLTYASGSERLLTHAATWTAFRFEPNGYAGSAAVCYYETRSKARFHHLDAQTIFPKSGDKAVIISETHGFSSVTFGLLGIKSSDPLPSICINLSLGKPQFSSLPQWTWNELEQGNKFKSYAGAISRSIKSWKATGSISPHIVHIGSASSCGSLACYSALSGARVTCQSSNPQASDLMSRVLALNCPRKSTAKIVQRLDASILPADVLVLESLDVGLLGENCLHQLAEAHQDGLISDKTEIIPSNAVVWSVLASVTIQDCKLRGGETIDLSPLDIFDRCLTDEGYSSINLSSDPRKITFLSEPVVAMNIDFTSDMNGLLMSREQSVVFNCTEGGRANAIISWFSSFADKDHLFTTGPGQAMDAALYWLPFESVKANDQVGVKITQVPNGIAFKFDGTAVSHRSHSVLLKKMKLAHRSLTASLSGSHMALMDPAESRQIALLALNLSSHSPTAATFHQRIISTL